jgi:predicted ABC-type transport system involved in lysophospholipase L1 biosynthesis ATPase subunit
VVGETVSQRRANAFPLVRLERVSRTFDDGAVVALRDVDLAIHAGDCVGVLGPSGSGKSSLIHLMGGCDMPTAGRIYWRGAVMTSIAAWSRVRGLEIGVVFQDYLLLPTLTALENVEMALMRRGLSASARRRRAAELLEQTGLKSRMGHLPFALSGGERQRVAIARSIANRPALLLADEPTGNLDSANARAIADLLFEIQSAEGAALVLVTHDGALAARCSRTVRIKDGAIVSDSAVDAIPVLASAARLGEEQGARP